MNELPVAQNRIWVQRHYRAYAFSVINRPNHSGYQMFAALPPAAVELQEGDDPPTTFSLHLEAAQELMDELWRCGLRPTEVGTAGELAAVRYHLQDMRALAFTRIGVDKP